MTLFQVMAHLWKLGYAAEDLISNMFRVCKTMKMPEFLQLEFVKVSLFHLFIYLFYCLYKTCHATPPPLP